MHMDHHGVPSFRLVPAFHSAFTIPNVQGVSKGSQVQEESCSSADTAPPTSKCSFTDITPQTTLFLSRASIELSANGSLRIGAR